ncbi:hypothetical protein [Aeromicrobium sp. UC242_57]|uniref:hypothetical protein n=1 Tax=Aeromicrobium sp. UC242_57 TaxID=3374624 RepID=UPI00378CEAB0
MSITAAMFAFPSAQAEPAVTVKDVEAAFHDVEAMNEQVNAPAPTPRRPSPRSTT